MSWEQSLSTYYVPGLLLASVLVFPWLDPTPLSSPGPVWVGLLHAVCPLDHELPKDKACISLAPQCPRGPGMEGAPLMILECHLWRLDHPGLLTESGHHWARRLSWSCGPPRSFLDAPSQPVLPESAASPLSSPALPIPRHTRL